MKKYTYDAFISYRHTELDKFVAENLHKQLEAFRLPGNISKNKKGRTKIERVFRDKDELPLTSNLEDPLMKALHNSEYLIVICSPRLKESMWCKKEIETFIEIHGREKILSILIEGEPEDTFPEALLFEEAEIQNEDGTFDAVRKKLDPLFADVRGKSKHAILKNLRAEILRLLAPIFSLSYDDLRQRHRERRFKRIMVASLIGMLVCLAFGAVSTTMALRIQNQKQQIETQNDEIIAQSIEIKFQNQSLLKNQAVNLAEESMRLLEAGDRVGAINIAVSALTQYEGIDMPYTHEAQFALTQSLHAYDNGNYMKAQYQLVTAGIVDFMLSSPDGEKLLTYDDSNTLTLWDVQSGSKLEEFKDLGTNIFWESCCTFIGNDQIAYFNSDRSINIYNVSQKKTIDIVEIFFSTGIYSDAEGKYLVVKDDYNIFLLDGESLEELAVYEASDGYTIKGELVINDEGTYLVLQEILESEDFIGNAPNENLLFWNLTDNQVSSPLDIGANRLETIRYTEDAAYILLNKVGNDYGVSQATLIAYSLKSEEVIWKKTFEDEYGNYLTIPYAEGADKLLYSSSFEANLIHMADGSEYAKFPMGKPIVGTAVYTNVDFYLVFTRNGEYYTIVVEDAETYTFADQFQCHSQNIKKLQIAANGYLVLPHQDNKVTFYDYSIGGGLVESSEDTSVSLPETESWHYNDAVDFARDKGLERAALARHIFNNNDKSILFVYYSDNTLELYDTSDMNLLCSLSGITGEVQKYLGTDDQGSLYVTSSDYGYMISSDYKLLGMIEGLAMVGREENCLVISDTYQTFYTVPIYTVEELLAMADAYVLK